MKIEYKTEAHPIIKSRMITLLFIDDFLDIPSSKFLVYESRYGGRYMQIAGISTHHTKAIKIGELFRHLNELNVTWRTANEFHIKAIRNAMLCWDNNNNTNHSQFNYKPISNNAMNQKLNIWFKFYNYMKNIGNSFDMIMSTKRIKKKTFKGINHHLNLMHDSNTEYIDIWSLKVKASPFKYSYHAISRTEYEYLIRYLTKIDIVYAMIALLMVETGLRITAALSIKQENFRGFFKYLNSGKNIDDIVKMDYLSKGGDQKQCDLPIRTIAELQKNYFVRTHVKRAKKHSNRSDRLKSCNYNPNAMWLLSNGREVNKTDLQRAFKKASIEMGYKVNTITPHWMRHTFATWTLMDYAEANNIPLKNTGTVPNPIFMILLQEKMGHADIFTTMRYIATALKLMGVGANNGPIKISFRTFSQDLRAQKLVKREAIAEFEDEFNENIFDVYQYAMKRGIVVKDER